MAALTTALALGLGAFNAVQQRRAKKDLVQQGVAATNTPAPTESLIGPPPAAPPGPAASNAAATAAATQAGLRQRRRTAAGVVNAPTAHPLTRRTLAQATPFALTGAKAY